MTEDPRMYSIARKVTDEVLGKGTYDKINHPALRQMADIGDRMVECPLCFGHGYEHEPDCPNVPYIDSILNRIADGFDIGALHDGEDIRAVRDRMGEILG